MKVISITGGKGGVGKTTIAVNMAVSLGRMGKKVLLFDADLGLANVDVLLGLTPARSVMDVIAGHCQLSQVCINGPYGIKIIPSASGIQSLADLSSTESIGLIRAFSTLTDDIDVMIVDVASGISRQVIDFTYASQHIVMSVCNDPSSLMDSYAVIKILHQQYGRNSFGILINKTKNRQEGYEVFSRFQDTVTRFMNIELCFLGSIPQDDYVHIAAKQNLSLVDKYPLSPAGIAFHDISQGVINWTNDNTIPGGIQFFLEKLLSTERSGANLCEA